MRRTWLAGIAGAVLVGGLSAGVVVASADPDDDKGRSPARSKGQDARDHGRGFGPPSWAQAHGSTAKDHKDHKDRAWHDEWRAMTPAQRKERMRALTEAHADGMRDFAACAAEARGAARDDCQKPLPPGQAKRLPVS